MAKKSKQQTEAINSLIEQNNMHSEKLSSNPSDSVDLFFNSVALSVKKLPPRAINEAKLQILSLVAQLEDYYCNSDTSQLHQSNSTSYQLIQPSMSQSTQLPPINTLFKSPTSTPYDYLTSNDQTNYQHL